MKVLLDTCVLSELRHPQGDQDVIAAIRALDEDDLFISAISIGELTRGVALLDPGARKRALSAWLDGLERLYSPKTLSIDAQTARIWGELTARAQQAGRKVGTADGLIAATALQHGLHVATRNVKDFVPTGAMIFNPWEG